MPLAFNTTVESTGAAGGPEPGQIEQVFNKLNLNTPGVDSDTAFRADTEDTYKAQWDTDILGWALVHLPDGMAQPLSANILGSGGTNSIYIPQQHLLGGGLVFFDHGANSNKRFATWVWDSRDKARYNPNIDDYRPLHIKIAPGGTLWVCHQHVVLAAQVSVLLNCDFEYWFGH